MKSKVRLFNIKLNVVDSDDALDRKYRKQHCNWIMIGKTKSHPEYAKIIRNALNKEGIVRVTAVGCAIAKLLTVIHPLIFQDNVKIKNMQIEHIFNPATAKKLAVMKMILEK